MLAVGGSILGIGSDVAGSLRIPAHFSGVCGLKPTNGRVYQGGRRMGPGVNGSYLKHGIYSAAGFMAPSVPGLVLGMKSLLEKPDKMANEDWRVAPLPWRQEMLNPKKRLKIGWYDQDGVFPATPGCSRAVREVVDKLKEAGHEVIQWTPPGLFDAFLATVDFILADQGYHSLQAWDGEILDQAIELNAIVYKTPQLLKWLLSPILKFFSYRHHYIFTSGVKYSRDLWVTNAQKDRMTYDFMDAWNKEDFDALLCPAFSFPACPSHVCSRLLPGNMPVRLDLGGL